MIFRQKPKEGECAIRQHQDGTCDVLQYKSVWGVSSWDEIETRLPDLTAAEAHIDKLISSGEARGVG